MNENNGTVTVCLEKNVTTDGQIIVVLDAEEEMGVPNPASSKSTMSCILIVSLYFLIPVSIMDGEWFNSAIDT